MGCSLLNLRGSLPSEHELVVDQLTIHTDFLLPRSHHVIDNLVALRYEISNTLQLPNSETPIHVYLFDREKKLRYFASKNGIGWPDRRAFFIKNSEGLTVIAYWSERITEDIRHEVTHGYLHAVLPSLPHWLDEGLAEYFEVQPNGEVNRPHVKLLIELSGQNRWKPNLARLESIPLTANLSRTDYAEAWLWTHFFLTTDDSTRTIICQSLRDLQTSAQPVLLATQLQPQMPDWEQRILQHLQGLAESPQ